MNQDVTIIEPAEKYIQLAVVNYAKSLGVMCYNIPAPKGVPDRIFIYMGRCIFIEFKKKSGKLSQAQKVEHKRIKDNFTDVYVVSDVKSGMDIIMSFCKRVFNHESVK